MIDSQSPGSGLAQRLEAALPLADVSVETLANGAFLIDFTLAGRDYVLAAFPGRPLGLMRLGPSPFGWEAAEAEFDHEDDLIRHLAALAVPA